MEQVDTCVCYVNDKGLRLDGCCDVDNNTAERILLSKTSNQPSQTKHHCFTASIEKLMRDLLKFKCCESVISSEVVSHKNRKSEGMK